MTFRIYQRRWSKCGNFNERMISLGKCLKDLKERKVGLFEEHYRNGLSKIRFHHLNFSCEELN